MSRIAGTFAQLRKENKKALIPFVTAGDPDLQTTVALVKEMIKQGADLIELGIPYSDPIAEGPVIQAANIRALQTGIRIRDVMKAVELLRQEISVPIVYLLYYNCIFQYGIEDFFTQCAKVGVDGVIIPDLPYEEKEEIADTAEKHEVDIISLVSPTSRERIQKIARDARGFLYCVSSTGVTGIRSTFDTDFDEFFSWMNQASDIPKALGFGISTPEQVSALKKYCDGLIVGSAIVKRVGQNAAHPHQAVESVGSFVRELRTALDS